MPRQSAPADLYDQSLASLTVMETAAAFRVSRNLAYSRARSGEWPTIRVGRRILIPASWVREQLGITAA